MFVYIFHRLAQAENKCKQTGFWLSLLRIFGSMYSTHPHNHKGDIHAN